VCRILGCWARAGLQSGTTEDDSEVKKIAIHGLGLMTRLSILGIKVPVIPIRPTGWQSTKTSHQNTIVTDHSESWRHATLMADDGTPFFSSKSFKHCPWLEPQHSEHRNIWKDGSFVNFSSPCLSHSAPISVMWEHQDSARVSDHTVGSVILGQ
jgi:hypothetical protein